MHSAKPASKMPPGYTRRPIDDEARNGSSRLLSDGVTLAIGRWDGARWVYPMTSRPLDITPTEVLL